MEGVVFGFGRMGITHIALLNQFCSDPINWAVIEPSYLPRLAGRFLFRSSQYKFYKKVPSECQFDFALVCSPVPYHEENYVQCRDIARKIFVEKPINISVDNLLCKSNVLPGYVLRHNAMIKYFRDLTIVHGLVNLNVSVAANTACNDGSGWRFDQEAGVIQEFGCHVVNLGLFYSSGQMKLSRTSSESVVTSVPDRFSAEFDAGGAKVSVFADWCDASKRKPAYRVDATLENGYTVMTDLYEIIVLDESGNLVEHRTLAHEGTSTPYYLRGFEFSEQARYFMDKNDFSDDLDDAVQTDFLLMQITNEINSR